MLARRRRQLRTGPVVRAEAAPDDGARDRLAARAAELALDAKQKKSAPAGGRNRQAAVEAGSAQETVMRREALPAFFGRTSLRTPSRYSAMTALSSTSTGSVKLRATMP